MNQSSRSWRINELLLFVQPAIRLIREFAPRIARGFAEYEKPLFKWAYSGQRLGRIGKPIYRGYKAGTIIGLAGDAILDALLTESYVSETSQERKTRNYMVKSRAKRKYKTNCYPRKRNRYSKY